MNDCIHRTRPVILSVDDEPCVSRVLQMKLQDSGYDVIRAENGLDGFKQFTDCMPDVLITDVNMPGMSGIELVKRCLEYRDTRSFLIAVLTSHIDEVTAQWLGEKTDVICLPKPFSPRRLLRMVDCYIKTRNLPEEALS